MHLAALREVHRDLHRVFRWQDDQVTWRRPEHWTRPREEGGRLVGDCDDWALEVDARLRAAGAPLSARRLAVCRISRRSRWQDHCVFVLSEDEELWVSCCNQAEVQRLGSLPYDQWLLSPLDAPIDHPWQPISS